MFNDKRSENRKIKEEQTNYSSSIFKHFINNLIKQHASESQQGALTAFNLVNFAFSTLLLATSFNHYSSSDLYL